MSEEQENINNQAEFEMHQEATQKIKELEDQINWYKEELERCGQIMKRSNVALRDEIAIAAMQGMLSRGDYWGMENDGLAPRLPLQTLVATSFEFADEFLKQRSKTND